MQNKDNFDDPNNGNDSQGRKFDQFLAKYQGVQLVAAKDLPTFQKAIIGIAGVSGASHGLLAWAHADPVAYLSLNVTTLALGVLLLLAEKRKKNDERKENEISV